MYSDVETLMPNRVIFPMSMHGTFYYIEFPRNNNSGSMQHSLRNRLFRSSSRAAATSRGPNLFKCLRPWVVYSAEWNRCQSQCETRTIVEGWNGGGSEWANKRFDLPDAFVCSSFFVLCSPLWIAMPESFPNAFHRSHRTCSFTSKQTFYGAFLVSRQHQWG